ncbi:Rhodanese-like protein [Wallemia mellicola]|uniref:M-phase inducer phosphatase n=1 Tax=Wallemia mellicola TaxID=1708541 RepID=A0A4T0NT05_9BASI|nr:Rhodanese-like protein [Wallemia mellicola]
MTAYLPRQQSHPPSSSPIESEFPPIYLNTPNSSPKNSNQDIEDDALADVSFASSISISTSSPSPNKPDINDLSLNENQTIKSNKPFNTFSRGKKRVGLPAMWSVTKESISPPTRPRTSSKRNAVMFEPKSTIIPSSPASSSSATSHNHSMSLDNPQDSSFDSSFSSTQRPRAPSEPSKSDYYYHNPSPARVKKPRLSPLKPPFMSIKTLGRAYSAPGNYVGESKTISGGFSPYQSQSPFLNSNSKYKSAPIRERRQNKKNRLPMPSFDQQSPSLFNDEQSENQPEPSNTFIKPAPFRRAFSLVAPNPMANMPSPGLDSSPCADASPSIRPLSQQIQKPANPIRPSGPLRALSALQGPTVSPRGVQIPGFGHSEKEGKLLPCFSVKDDGLMRIQPETLDKLISEPLPESISDVHVVDCRFPFEYHGGHLPGAVNLGTLQSVENYFLIPNAGANRDTKSLPTPSTSASSNESRKVIIFHCEFSNMRAPTLAKHLRSLDRSRNEHPNLNFPELYILSGGYAEYFRQFHNVKPELKYTPMDAPHFHPQREAHLAAFRASSKPSSIGCLNMGLRSKSFTFATNNSRLTNVSKLLQDQTVTEESDTSMEASPCGNNNMLRPSLLNRTKSLAKLQSSPLTLDFDEKENNLSRDLTFVERN